mmetsp:Transcript_18463/g.17771  ORF Transcript_18463/g.17771 Transcript_18463/m.17771 type:complete len:89 (+) Transcript_18463:691-957(+)
MQRNSYSCGIFASVRLQYWCIHRRFPTVEEFSQRDDGSFRLYMVKRILQFHNKKKGSRSHLSLMNNRRRNRMVHTLTDNERNLVIEIE